MFDLNDGNFLIYAAKCYDRPHILQSEFEDDLRRTVNMLFYKVDKDDYPILKTFLIFLNYMPDHLKTTFDKYYVRQEEIPVDLSIADRLRNI